MLELAVRPLHRARSNSVTRVSPCGRGEFREKKGPAKSRPFLAWKVGKTPGSLPATVSRRPRQTGPRKDRGNLASEVPIGVGTLKQLVQIAALLVGVAVPAGATHLPQTEPDASLSPRDVVSIQIEALKNNDIPYENRGIEVTFNFASPANKRMTGPFESFKVMVRSPTYGPMINHRNATYENLKVKGDVAQVDVIMMSKDGENVGYRFILSRQHGNQYEGSWMTDTVVRFDVVSL